MGKSPKQKYYAVKIGREGPQIYHSWDECVKMVSRFPGAVHKSFTSLSQAQEWLKSPRSVDRLPQSMISARSSNSSCVNPARVSLDPPRPKVLTPLPPQIQLSPEQTTVLNMFKAGRNVFFTGSAGTGKSVLLKEIIRYCGGRSPRLAVTASTGMASVNIGGVTLHSFAGIGLGEKPPNVYLHMFKGDAFDKVVQRWRDVKTLVIDEISMIDGILFDKLEYIARHIRQNDKPFGGIQLVLSGDFCQLPPVEKNNSDTVFAFDADSWNRCVGSPISLTRVFRQKDQAFIDMLNEIRFGRLDEQTVAQLGALSRSVAYNDAVEPTDLFPTIREVQKENNARLDKLPGNPEVYLAFDSAGENESNQSLSHTSAVELLNRNLLAPERIALKVGAQVMLIKNLVQGELVNGSTGKVVAFLTSREAQSTNTDIALIDRGQDSVSNNYQKYPMPQALLNNPMKWPVVCFTNGKTKFCVPTDFTIENVHGRLEASRTQVPLILAWALSIHKSQGQTLERVRVNLGRIFAKGQAYVALSRATSMETLQVLSFDRSRIKAHPRVLAWNKEILERKRHLQEFEDEVAVTSYFSQ